MADLGSISRHLAPLTSPRRAAVSAMKRSANRVPVPPSEAIELHSGTPQSQGGIHEDATGHLDGHVNRPSDSSSDIRLHSPATNEIDCHTGYASHVKKERRKEAIQCAKHSAATE